MNQLIPVMVGAIIAAGLSVGALAQHGHQTDPRHGAAHQQASSAGEVTVEGELIDTACYVASDGEAKGKEHAECAQKCMGSGVPAAILPTGSKDAAAILFLLTNPRPLAQYASKTIKVEGTSHPDMKALDVKKLFVKDDAGNWKEVQLDDEHHKMSGAAPSHDHKGPK
jgi:hypothetical protein